MAIQLLTSSVRAFLKPFAATVQPAKSIPFPIRNRIWAPLSRGVHYHSNFYGEPGAGKISRNLYLSSQPNAAQMAAVLRRVNDSMVSSVYCPQRSLDGQKNWVTQWLAVMKTEAFKVTTQSSFVTFRDIPIQRIADEICTLNRHSSVTISIPAAAEEPAQ